MQKDTKITYSRGNIMLSRGEWMDALLRACGVVADKDPEETESEEDVEIVEHEIWNKEVMFTEPVRIPAAHIAASFVELLPARTPNEDMALMLADILMSAVTDYSKEGAMAYDRGDAPPNHLQRLAAHLLAKVPKDREVEWEKGYRGYFQAKGKAVIDTVIQGTSALPSFQAGVSVEYKMHTMFANMMTDCFQQSEQMVQRWGEETTKLRDQALEDEALEKEEVAKLAELKRQMQADRDEYYELHKQLKMMKKETTAKTQLVAKLEADLAPFRPPVQRWSTSGEACSWWAQKEDEEKEKPQRVKRVRTVPVWTLGHLKAVFETDELAGAWLEDMQNELVKAVYKPQEDEEGMDLEGQAPAVVQQLEGEGGQQQEQPAEEQPAEEGGQVVVEASAEEEENAGSSSSEEASAEEEKQPGSS